MAEINWFTVMSKRASKNVRAAVKRVFQAVGLAPSSNGKYKVYTSHASCKVLLKDFSEVEVINGSVTGLELLIPDVDVLDADDELVADGDTENDEEETENDELKRWKLMLSHLLPPILLSHLLPPILLVLKLLSPKLLSRMLLVLILFLLLLPMLLSLTPLMMLP